MENSCDTQNQTQIHTKVICQLLIGEPNLFFRQVHLVVKCIRVVIQSHVNNQACCEIDLEFGCVVGEQNVILLSFYFSFFFFNEKKKLIDEFTNSDSLNPYS